VIAHVVDGEDDRKILDERIITKCATEENGNQGGLPIVAMENIGGPNVLGDFDRGSTKLTVTLGIVTELAVGATINAVAIEEGWIVDEKVANTVDRNTVGYRWKTNAIPNGDSETGNYDGGRFCAAIAGQDHSDFVTVSDESFGQGFNDIG